MLLNLAFKFHAVFDFLLFWESDAKSYGCDIFTCTLVSCVIVSPLHLRTLRQGPWVSSKTVFTHLSSHRVAPIAHCAPHSQVLRLAPVSQGLWCIRIGLVAITRFGPISKSTDSFSHTVWFLFSWFYLCHFLFSSEFNDRITVSYLIVSNDDLIFFRCISEYGHFPDLSFGLNFCIELYGLYPRISISL